MVNEMKRYNKNTANSTEEAIQNIIDQQDPVMKRIRENRE
jgi:hypothetical protein